MSVYNQPLTDIKAFAAHNPDAFVNIIDEFLNENDDVNIKFAQKKFISYFRQRLDHDTTTTTVDTTRPLSLSNIVSSNDGNFHQNPPTVTVFSSSKLSVSPDEALPTSADDSSQASMYLPPSTSFLTATLGQRRRSRSGSVAAIANSSIANQLSTTDQWIRRRWSQHHNRELDHIAELQTKRTTFENHKLRLRHLRMSKDILTEDSLLRELIIDVAKELDVDMLCCKVLQNVLALINGDRGSLFLATSNAPGVAGPALVSQLFDITLDTNWADVVDCKKGKVILPYGKGIAGIVAQTLEPISINDAYADARFDKSVDKATGYRTRCLLCYPIISADGQLIGVAQIINKQSRSTTGRSAATLRNSSAETFTSADEAVFAQYLIFCGIGLQNAQLFEVSVQEHQRNQLLLSLARSIFCQQLSIERIVRQMMQQCKTLVPCECCWILLLDVLSVSAHEEYAKFDKRRMSGASVWSLKQKFDNVSNSTARAQYQTPTDIHFSEAYALPDDSNTSAEVVVVPPTDLDDSWVLELSRAVVFSKRPIRLEKDTVENQSLTLKQHLSLLLSDTSTSFNDDITNQPSLDIYKTTTTTNDDENSSADEKNYLAVPVFNAQQRVVATIIMEARHDNDEFGVSDMQMMEAFAIFCGLGITNAQLYEKALHWCARQQVALEVISYHAMATQSDVDQLQSARLQPAAHWNLYNYQFDDTALKDEQTLQASLAMFADLGLNANFTLDASTLCRWLCSVRKNYRPVKYHNWRHAFNVAQTMFSVLTTGSMQIFFDPLTVFGLIVAAFCHDLDHRGTNNAFQSLAGTGLAVLYGTSVMEHHHFNQCMLLLSAPNNNIFHSLNTAQYKRVVGIIERCILATDLAMFFRKKDEFAKMADEYNNKYKIIEQQTSRLPQSDSNNVDSPGSNRLGNKTVVGGFMKKFIRSSSTLSTNSIRQVAQQQQHTSQSFLYWRDSGLANTLLSSMLMTACDVSAISKPWPIQKHVAQVVYDEFFDQGDIEKQAFGKISSDMLDRGKRADLPNMQVKFIDSVCEPLYKTLSSMFTGVAPLLNGCMVNRDRWLHETALHALEANGITADANIHQLPTEQSSEISAETAVSNVTNISPTRRQRFGRLPSTIREEQLKQQSFAADDLLKYSSPRRSSSAHNLHQDGFRMRSQEEPHERNVSSTGAERLRPVTVLPVLQSGPLDDEKMNHFGGSHSALGKSSSSKSSCGAFATNAGSCVCSLQ